MNRSLSDVDSAMSMDIFSTTIANKKPRGNKDQENQDEEGFNKVATKKRSAKKVFGPEIHKKVQTHNWFYSLQARKGGDTQKEGKLEEH